MNRKGPILIKILEWLGLLEKRQISKSDMCKQAQDVCNHNCDSCAWGDKEKE